MKLLLEISIVPSFPFAIISGIATYGMPAQAQCRVCANNASSEGYEGPHPKRMILKFYLFKSMQIAQDPEGRPAKQSDANPPLALFSAA